MSRTDRELLEGIQSLFQKLGADFELTDINGSDMLEFEYGGDETAPIDCTVNVERLENDSVAIQMMIAVFYGLDKGTSDCVAELLPSLNSRLEVGSFCLMPQEGFLYLNNAFLTDGLDDGSVALSLVANFELLTATAVQARSLLLPLVKGDIAPGDVQKDDMTIVQLS